MKAGSHPTISKSYNKTVNGQKVMMEHLKIKMVRGHKLVDEDGEFTMSEESEPEVSYRMSMWREKNFVKIVDNVSDVT